MIKKKEIKEQTQEEKIDELIDTLRKEKFGNEEQRKLMIDVLTSLHNIKDPKARKVFKKIGDFMSDYASDAPSSSEDHLDPDLRANIDNVEDTMDVEILSDEFEPYVYESEWDKWLDLKKPVKKEKLIEKDDYKKKIADMVEFGKKNDRKDFFKKFEGEDIINVAQAYRTVYKELLTAKILEKYGYA